MKYTHASSPAELNLAPLFPLPTEAFQDQLDMFGRFTGNELDLITHMNLGTQPPKTAVDHLLELRENPIAAAVESFGKELGAGPTVDTRAYRAGVCLAAAMFRQHAHNRGAIDAWPALTPGRTYLRVPEWLDSERALTYARLGLEGKPERTKYYVDTMSTERYVADGAALGEAITVMGESWEEHQDSILGAPRKRYASAPDLFGRTCQGFADTVRLRYALEYEQRVAPPGDGLYDPSQHFLLGEQKEFSAYAGPVAHEAGRPVFADSLFGVRLPVEGVTASYLFAEPDSEALVTTWGETRIPPGCVVKGVHRAIMGFVRDNDNSGIVIPVGFRKSLETFMPEPGDVLVTAGLGFGTLEQPFVTDELSSQVVAISERGAAGFLSNSNRLFSDPEFGEYDEGFQQVLRRALMTTADERQQRLLGYYMPAR